ncbi:MAG: hypothetical protein H7210_11830 [Pyrinomonadaceae bacterium]|nr:hypothetical protein [Phycisphaerales bacterium]
MVATRLAASCIGAAALFFPCTGAQATVRLELFRTLQYHQTSNATTDFVGCNFMARYTASAAGEAAAVSLDPPGASSGLSLTRDTPALFRYSQTFASQALMDAAFTMGTYSFQPSGGSATTPISMLQTSVTDYLPGVPTFSPMTFAALGAVDPSVTTSLSVGPYGPLSRTGQRVVVSITDMSDAEVWSLTYLSGTLTTVHIPANILSRGAAYNITLARQAVHSEAVSAPPFKDEFWSTATTAPLMTVPSVGWPGLALAGAVAISRRSRRSSSHAVRKMC